MKQERFDKRKSDRENLYLECTVKFQSGVTHRGFVTDISREGAFVESSSGPSPDEMVVLSFKYMKENLTMVCRVANRRPKRHTDGFGIYFVEYVGDSLEAMNRLLQHRARLSQKKESGSLKAG